jgi:RNA polymerase sigma factor (sigma-70 family)
MHTHSPDALIAQHMTLARQLAFRLARLLPRFVDADALESDAMLGLIQAARTFDPERGVSFATYASRRIRGAMIDGLRQREHLRGTDTPPAFVSMDMRIGDEDGRPATLGELLPADDEPFIVVIERRDEVNKLLRSLDRQSRQLVEDFYLHDMTQEAIGCRCGRSPSGISQRLGEARRRMQAAACPSLN